VAVFAMSFTFRGDRLSSVHVYLDPDYTARTPPIQMGMNRKCETSPRRESFASVSMTRRRLSRADCRIAICDPASMKLRRSIASGPPSMLTLHDFPGPRRTARVLIALETAASAAGMPRFATARCDSPDAPDSSGHGVDWGRSCRRQRRASRRFRLGDHVYAYEFGNRQGGFYAEFAAQTPRTWLVLQGPRLRDAGRLPPPA